MVVEDGANPHFEKKIFCCSFLLHNYPTRNCKLHIYVRTACYLLIRHIFYGIQIRCSVPKATNLREMVA